MIYVPRLLELGLTIPDPNLAGRDDEDLVVHRAGLGRASIRRDRAWPEVPGPAGVPTPESRRHPLGPRDGLQAAIGGGSLRWHRRLPGTSAAEGAASTRAARR